MASNATSIRAGRAFVELFADDTALVRGLRRAQKRLQAFGASVKAAGLKIAGLGAAMVAGLYGTARLFSTMGDHLAKMSKRTGMSVRALSELSYAASLSGTDLDTLEVGIRRMQRTVTEASTDVDGAENAFSSLGLSARTLAAQSPERQFIILADALSRVEDPTRRAALAMKIFGRGGTALLPLFRNGSAGMERLRREARLLGLSMSDEDAAAAEALHDSLDRLMRSLKMAAARIGAALAPALTELANRIARTAGRISAWISNNRGLIVSIAKIAVWMVVGGLAVAGLGVAILGVAKALSFLASTISAGIAMFKGAAAAIAFLRTPMGMVIVAIVALTAALLYFTGAGGRAMRWMADRFSELADRARATFGGIADAIAAGDVGLAARILWLWIKMEWDRGIQSLEMLWLNFKHFFVRIGTDAWTGLLAAVQIAWHAIEIGWLNTVAFLGSAWTRFAAFFASSWERLKAVAAKAWAWIKGIFSQTDRASQEEVYARIDQERDQALAQIAGERDREIAQREAELERRKEESRALNDATLAQLGEDNLAQHAQLDAEYERRRAENDAELEAARKEWEDAIAEARKRRQQSDRNRPGTESNLQRSMDDLAGTLGGQISARGSFMVSNLLGLQAADATGRMAEGIDQIERNTRPLRNATSIQFE